MGATFDYVFEISEDSKKASNCFFRRWRYCACTIFAAIFDLRGHIQGMSPDLPVFALQRLPCGTWLVRAPSNDCACLR
jgi:hypothetical protein